MLCQVSLNGRQVVPFNMAATQIGDEAQSVTLTFEPLRNAPPVLLLEGIRGNQSSVSLTAINRRSPEVNQALFTTTHTRGGGAIHSPHFPAGGVTLEIRKSLVGGRGAKMLGKLLDGDSSSLLSGPGMFGSGQINSSHGTARHSGTFRYREPPAGSGETSGGSGVWISGASEVLAVIVKLPLEQLTRVLFAHIPDIQFSANDEPKTAGGF